MPSNPDQLRDEMGMSEWRDNELVQMLSQRYAEQSVITQLMTVSPERAAAYGIELLLIPEVEGERPDNVPRDGLFDAMVAEARHRIATRFEHGAYTLNG